METQFDGRTVPFENGSKLLVKAAPYTEAEELLSAFLESIQGMPGVFDSPEALLLMAKSTISRAFIVPSFKVALWKCLGRCLYQSANMKEPAKVTPALFEAVADRENLVEVWYECAEENLRPFGKGLYAVSGRLSKVIESSLTSKS